METRLEVKPFEIAIFKVTWYNLTFYTDEGVITDVVKLKMVSRDPLTGDSDDNEWGACEYSYYL